MQVRFVLWVVRDPSELLGLLFVRELDRLYVMPGVEDTPRLSSALSSVVQDHTPVAYLLQLAAQPSALRTDTYNHLAPDPRLWG